MNNFENSYNSLDSDAKHICCILALSPYQLSVPEILTVASIKQDIKSIRLQDILYICLKKKFLINNYYEKWIAVGHFTVWLYPLISGYDEERKYFAEQIIMRKMYTLDTQIILSYLDALWNNSNQLNEIQSKILRYSERDYLEAIFEQPLYRKVYERISPQIIENIFQKKSNIIYQTLDSCLPLYNIIEDFSKGLILEQALLALKTGDWEKARLLTQNHDSDIACYAEAMKLFFDNNYTGAMEMFEKALKKQRREYKQSYVPIIPEIALFYIMMLFSSEENDISVLMRIIDKKTKSYSYTDRIFIYMCYFNTSDKAESYSNYFKHFSNHESPEVTLWKVIALGYTGEPPQERNVWLNKALVTLKRAFTNGFYPAAYEAAYVLKEMGVKEADDIYQQLSAKLKYKSALSKNKLVEPWEKQINSYMSLEAVKTIIRKENDAGKSRVAYRFNPRGYAQPILQTRQANGMWTAGRNIAMVNFLKGKIDGMTEQDKRIAKASAYNYYQIEKRGIVEMTGHPYVFLEESNIPVELVAAKPILNVVELQRGGYKLECDVTDLRSEIYIEKETNTRYKVYKIEEAQQEIITAIKNGKKIPLEGKEKLLKVLELFSAYMTVQTNLEVGEGVVQARQIEPDSRIRIQILPLGEGLKAEMFVKPFGTNPPYCKPGKGGMALMSNQGGERLQVTRNLALEIEYSEKILSEIQTIEGFDINDGLMTFTNPLDALELLEILKLHTDISVVEWPEGERLKVRYSANFNNLDIRLTSGIDWFELDGELKLDENLVISIGQLLELVKHGHGRFIELKEGEFIALTEHFKRRLEELSAFVNITKKTATLNRFASASLIDSFDEFENLKTDKAWSNFRKQLKQAHNVNTDIPDTLRAELRPYQEEGYRWMTRLAAWGAGACLSDDMGLGKTVQAIAILLKRVEIGPALVVSPLSVKYNWISEVNRFAPSLTVKTLNNSDRNEILASLSAGDLLITSYGLLQSEVEALASVEWATVVLDEAHAIKNYNTKTSKAAMTLKAGFRIILTGTPLQNHLGEMWNLFQFINPGLLGSLSHFTENFIKPVDNNARKRLKKLITPFILRRTKSAVLEELPPKTEIIRKIDLSDEEKAFYEALRRKAIETIQNDDSPYGTKHLKALAEITRLRQACCNPQMVEPKIDIGSTKLATFLEIATELKENGHRALVFSQFVTHLTLIRKALDSLGFSYQYLDGSTPSAKREEAVKKFQTGKGDLFLISLKAGGLGLNLTAADYVIHLDPWWNPSVEDQASDRAHRIGQSRPVTVYRLVAENTIEEKIIKLHNTKRDLADSLLEGSDKSAKLSIEELMSLIKGEG